MNNNNQLATLAVQEAMGLKVDREAVATLVLPQLWTMSMGPCMLQSGQLSPLTNSFNYLFSVINVAQFQRFMEVIKKLGDRVEREHLQHLKDSQRIEDRSGSGTGMSTAGNGSANGLDFASLVAGASTSTVKPDVVIENGSTNGKSWDDDVWGSLLNDVRSFSSWHIFGGLIVLLQSPQLQSPGVASTPLQAQTPPVHSPPLRGLPPPMTSSSSFNRSPLSNNTPRAPMSTFSSPVIPQSVQSPSLNTYTPPPQQAPVQPTFPSYSNSLAPSAPPPPLQPSKPNYNVTLPAAGAFTSMSTPPLVASPPPLSMDSILAPSTPLQPWNASSSKKPNKDDWGDFDPLG